MRTKIIKRVSFLFVIFYVFTAVTMSSCAEGGNSGEADPSESSANENEKGADEILSEVTETEDSKILSEAPVHDYGGAEYRILGKLASTSNHHWDAIDLYAEEEIGDVIVDAVYRRNKAVEENFNVKISRKESATPSADLRTAVTAGTDEYDISYDGLAANRDLASGGFVLNLKSVPHIDLEKPWYDQNANAQLSIGGKLYTTFNDFTILDKEGTWVYLFNKKLVTDMNLDDPYQLVRAGKWTADKLFDMAREVSHDLDGDGVMGLHDRYGYMGEAFNMYAGIVSADVSIFVKDDADLPVYTGISERTVTAVAKLLQVFGDDSLSLIWENVGKKGFTGTDAFPELLDPAFMEGRILFNHAGMNRVTLFRSMDVDFGIIPSPKLDERQENYYSTISPDNAVSFVIPKSAGNLEMVGAITDALCAESMYTLIPAYYETQLKTKLSRDEESHEMLDLIFENRRFDLGLIYDFGGLRGVFSTAMVNNDTAVASKLESSQTRIETAIQRIAEAYAENAD
jgi:outer membrane lipoprotein-sorting protein